MFLVLTSIFMYLRSLTPLPVTIANLWLACRRLVVPNLHLQCQGWWFPRECVPIMEVSHYSQEKFTLTLTLSGAVEEGLSNCRTSD